MQSPGSWTVLTVRCLTSVELQDRHISMICTHIFYRQQLLWRRLDCKKHIHSRTLPVCNNIGARLHSCRAASAVLDRLAWAGVAGVASGRLARARMSVTSLNTRRTTASNGCCTSLSKAPTYAGPLMTYSRSWLRHCAIWSCGECCSCFHACLAGCVLDMLSHDI